MATTPIPQTPAAKQPDTPRPAPVIKKPRDILDIERYGKMMLEEDQKTVIISLDQWEKIAPLFNVEDLTKVDGYEYNAIHQYYISLIGLYRDFKVIDDQGNEIDHFPAMYVSGTTLSAEDETIIRNYARGVLTGAGNVEHRQAAEEQYFAALSRAQANAQRTGATKSHVEKQRKIAEALTRRINKTKGIPDSQPTQQENPYMQGSVDDDSLPVKQETRAVKANIQWDVD